MDYYLCFVTVAKTNNRDEKMGTVPTEQILCVKASSKMGLAERINEPYACELSPFFLLISFYNGHVLKSRETFIVINSLTSIDTT